jgi:shikimate kinase
MENVFLTGFMAAGKTAVGRALARRLGRRFVDLDDAITEEAGLSVADIFARFGERDFRERERRALERACALERTIVATGGGAVVDPRSRGAMRACGRIVCLTAEPEVLLSRLGDAANRPLLAGTADRAERLRELLAARAEAYGDADLIVDTSRMTTDDVTDAIAAWLASMPARSPRAGLGGE